MMSGNLPFISFLLVTVISFTAMPTYANNTPAEKNWGFTAFSPAMESETVKKVMAAVADWQIANPSQHLTDEWFYGALFTGMAAWSHISEDSKYVGWLKDMGEQNRWKLREDPYLADDQCVGQMYLDMYERFKDKDKKVAEEILTATKQRLDWILAHPSDASLEMGSHNCHDRWCWCDSLFMSPPIWAQMAQITGESKYLDFMNREWWATTDYLYDTEEHLYFRDSRFFKKREPNGRKVFWGRGNGWVFGGLVRVLEYLPEDYPYRTRYIKLYREMAEKLISIQQANGIWHSSLLDPKSYLSPEASGSGFFCYGLAWGINKGLVDRNTCLPAVQKAWIGLVKCVHPNGMLGYVQQATTAPGRIRVDSTEIYGVGAFLLAGSEVYKLSQE